MCIEGIYKQTRQHDYMSQIKMEDPEGTGMQRKTCLMQISLSSSSSMNSDIYWLSCHGSSPFSETRIRQFGTSGRKQNFLITESGSIVSVTSWPACLVMKASISNFSLLIKARTFLLLLFCTLVVAFLLPIVFSMPPRVQSFRCAFCSQFRSDSNCVRSLEDVLNTLNTDRLHTFIITCKCQATLHSVTCAQRPFIAGRREKITALSGLPL